MTNFDLTKPVHDEAKYDYLELNNGMGVLLISDPKSDRCAASLSVKAGSFEDPLDALGLAHFSEHMLFLGSEKYPEEIDFPEYINGNAGSYNAYTSKQFTTYFFSVSPEGFEGALDRFFSFFKAPLFRTDSAEREVKAVNSEFIKNQQSDFWRVLAVIQRLSNPKHPFSKFTTGNLETLQGLTTTASQDGSSTKDLQQILFNFWRAHYSSDKMKLAVFGPQDLETLKQITMSNFPSLEIRNNKEMKDVISYEIPKNIDEIFLKSQFNVMHNIVSVSEGKKLQIMFPCVYDEKDNYTSRPFSIISFLLGHEGKGSIFQTLSAKEYIHEVVSSDNSSDIEGIKIPMVSIGLSKKGEAKINEILAIVFEYLAKLKKNGIPDYLIEDIKKIHDNRFKFLEFGSAANRVIELPRKMFIYKPKDILSGPELITDDIEKVRKATMDVLEKWIVEENAMLFHLSKDKFAFVKHENGDEKQTFEKERFYGVEYQQIPFNLKEEIAKTRKQMIQTEEGRKDFESLYLPQQNPFIPDKFDLKYTSKDAKDLKGIPKLVRIGDTKEEKEYLEQFFEVWTANSNEDEQFALPKVNLSMSLYFPGTSVSPVTEILTRMFLLLIKDTINEDFGYEAEEGGLQYHFEYIRNTPITIIFGYDQKIEILTQKIFEIFGKIGPDSISNPKMEGRFNSLKEKKIREMKTFLNAAPYMVASEHTQFLLNNRFNFLESLIEAAENVNFHNLIALLPFLLSQLSSKVLIFGNCLPEESEKIVRTMQKVYFEVIPKTWSSRGLEKILPCSQTQLIQEQPTARKLPKKSDSFVMKTLMNPNEKNCAVSVIYQIGKLVSPCTKENPIFDLSNTTPKYIKALKRQVLTEFFDFFVNEEFFDQLRTKQSLGYVVQTRFNVDINAISLKFVVQSDSKTPLQVFNAIHEFVEKTIPEDIFARKLGANEQNVFEERKKSFIVSLLEKPKTLQSQVFRWIREIISDQYMFERNQKMAEMAETLTQEEFVNFHTKYFSCSSENSKTRRLVDFLYPHCHLTEMKELIEKKSQHPMILESLKNEKSQRKVRIFEKQEDFIARCSGYSLL